MLKVMFSLVLSIFCLSQIALALPAQHEALYKDSDAYRTMYDRYDIELQRLNDAFDEGEYDKVDKENNAVIEKSVKDAEAAGKNAALACAQAYGERILAMEQLLACKNLEIVTGNTNPLEGFYRLSGRKGYDGYLSIGRDGNGGYNLEIAVWEMDKPQTYGWSQFQTAKIGDSFNTTAVFDPQTTDEIDAKDIQAHIAIKDGQATVTTPEAFKKRKYVFFSRGEETFIKNIGLDGNYKHMPCGKTGK